MINSEHNKMSDFDPYQPESIPLFEVIYGKNLISLGGLAAIDNMFIGIEIKGLKALDLGFGLGGVAFYLAEKYQMIIAGIEVHPWMVRYAKDNAPENVAQMLEFDNYNIKGELPYNPESFDLVYSKGVLNHVSDKNSLFCQINAVLRPSGLFVIADWIFPDTISDNLAPLVCETKDSYTQVLTDNGFIEIEFRDDSNLFLGYTKEFLANLRRNQELIEQKYDHELFSTIRNQHEELIEQITHHHKFATRIVAKKVNS